jgi:hypothetical protein
MHDLGHGFAPMLINESYSLFSVQKLLGDNSLTMTQRYARLTKGELRETDGITSFKVVTMINMIGLASVTGDEIMVYNSKNLLYVRCSKHVTRIIPIGRLKP